MKGCDPGAQVSSSLPGQRGVGTGTSGLGECPFGDVRSSLAAPPVPPPPPRSRCPRGRAPDALHILRCAAPVRPHLPARRQGFWHNLSLAPPLANTAASGRQPRVLWRLPAPKTAPVRTLYLLFGKDRGERQKETPGLRRSPLLASNPLVVTGLLYCGHLHRQRGDFCFFG